MFWKSITKTACLLILLTVMPAEVRAQDGIASSTLPHESTEDASEPARYDIGEVMKFKAGVLNLLGTVVPIAAAVEISKASDDGHNQNLIGWLLVGGLFIGPSLGEFYARAPAQALVGIGVRGLGGLMLVAGAAQSIGSTICGGSDFGGNAEKECDDKSDGEGLIILGLVTYLGGVVYSLADGNMAVDRFLTRQEQSRFGWTPMIVAGKDGAERTGALAWMRF